MPIVSCLPALLSPRQEARYFAEERLRVAKLGKFRQAGMPCEYSQPYHKSLYVVLNHRLRKRADVHWLYDMHRTQRVLEKICGKWGLAIPKQPIAYIQVWIKPQFALPLMFIGAFSMSE